MKQRVISAFFIVLITLIAVLMGGVVLKGITLLMALYGSYELVRCCLKKLHVASYAVCAISSVCIILFNEYALPIICFELIGLFTVAIFDEKINIADTACVFLMSALLNVSLAYTNELSNYNKWLLGYVFVISYLTDAFALFAGMLFGKHKLNKRISPKKTIEGCIGGWIFGTGLSIAYAALFNWFNMEIYVVVICSIFLPLVTMIGDLAYSLVKRHYGIKDYSRLIPGHGGLLDRIDSYNFDICFLTAMLIIFKVL